ncbi:CPBP family intramembrane glutamic endopeptidase [Deltaproteobacteria bacterium TL4]
MKQYFQASHTAFYSTIMALPLLIGYEILLALTYTPYWKVRNAADMWLRNLLMLFDMTSQQATFIMIGILMAAIPFIRPPHVSFNIKVIGWMLIESMIYSLFLGIAIQSIIHPLFFSNTLSANNNTLQKLALSLGAGLFEEFIFRVLLLNALFYGLKPLIKNSTLTGIVVVLTTSFLFSLSHYVGSMSEVFNVYSFLFRWVAGLLFTILYFLRGFGITAYTHAFYDIHVLL